MRTEIHCVLAVVICVATVLLPWRPPFAATEVTVRSRLRAELERDDASAANAAVSTIREMLHSDPRPAADWLANDWMPALLAAGMHAEAAELALAGTLARPRASLVVVSLQKSRAEALQALKKHDEALAAAKPLDGRAAGAIADANAFFRQPASARLLTEKDTAKYVMMASEDSVDMQLVAIVYLAFGTNAESKAILEKLTQSSNEVVRGAASYALRWRLISTQPSESVPVSLALALGKSEHVYERLFIANRLAVDFPKASMWAILQAAKVESDSTVRSEMLRYLAHAEDQGLSAALKSHKWLPIIALPENLETLLMAITPSIATKLSTDAVRDLHR